MKVLFVCMGNICRSPAGEGVFQSMVDESGLSDQIEVDSAGTLGYHAGEPADSRMQQAAQKRGYALTSRARQVQPRDLDQFDLVLTMDEDNYNHVCALAENKDQQERVISFCDFCKEHESVDVPDPYYGGAAGFERVLDLLEDGCQGLLEEVQERLNA